jgi:hypothetical protein
MGSLNVYSQLEDDGIKKPINELWSLSSELGDMWHFARLSTDYRSDFRIIFEGSLGESPAGDIVEFLFC